MKLNSAYQLMAAVILLAVGGWAQLADSQEAVKAEGESAFSKAAATAVEQAQAQPVPAVGAPVAAQKQQSIIDLHTHSYCSDGKLTPEQLAQRAKNAGIIYWALTDHDTTACLARAQAAAQAAGIKFLPGIEISAEDDSVHILGIGIDPNFSGWKAYIDNMQTERIARAKRIIDLLNKIPDPNDENAKMALDFKTDILLPRLNLERKADGKELLTAKDAGNMTEEQLIGQIRGQLTRPDIARALVEKGYVKNAREAFDKYIGNNGPGDVPMNGVSFQDAIAMIHQAGGKAMLAHPYTIYKFKKFPLKYHGKEYADFNALSKSLIDSKLDGFETLRPGSTAKDMDTVKDSIKAAGGSPDMLMSAGSDYHGYDDGAIGPKAIGGAPVTQEQTDALVGGLGL